MSQSQKARRRDNHICLICDGFGNTCHHRRPKRYSHDSRLWNLVTLCHKCHKIVEVCGFLISKI